MSERRASDAASGDEQERIEEYERRMTCPKCRQYGDGCNCHAANDLEVGVRCGNCGGNVFMATCHHFRGTGHEWVLATLCMICRAAHWTEEGCHEC